MLGLPTNLSGDALAFQLGPRWTPIPTGKWSPYGHVLVGGMKVTQETMFPEKKAEVEAANQNIDPMLAYTLHDQYTSHAESTGLAVTAGAGVDYKLSAALALRVANFEYLYSNARPVNGSQYASGFQFTTGVVLRLGTW
jgi:opacity protein-like surface antigen